MGNVFEVENRCFVGTTQRHQIVVVRALLDRFTCEAGDDAGAEPIDRVNPLSRQKHGPSSGPPVSSVDCQIKNDTGLIIEDEARHVTYARVTRLYVVTRHSVATSQMHILPWRVCLKFIRLA